jgi:anti-sigma factor ChrR (cupin superfamily)
MRPLESPHPDPMLLASYAEGRLADGPHVEAVESHLERCARCRAALTEAIPADDGAEAGAASEFVAAAKSAGAGGRRWLWAATAAAVVLLGVLGTQAVRHRGADASVMRGETRTVVLLAPANGGMVDATPVALRWQAVPGADLYRVAIDDVEGHPQARLETPASRTEATWAAPAAIGGSYRWHVEAVAQGRVLASSGVATFRRP